MNGTRRLGLLAVAAVFVGAVVAVPIVTDSGGNTETVTGRLSIVHADDFVHDRTIMKGYVVQSGGKRVKVQPPPDEPVRSLVGSIVRVEGDMEGRTIDADSVERVALPLPLASTHRVAVFLVNFSNDTRQPWTPAFAQAVMSTNPDSVAHLYSQASDGQLTIQPDVLGWYTLPMSNAGCDINLMASQAKSAATAAGVDLSVYQHFMYAFPGASCGWSGLGDMPGRETWINGSFSSRLTGHELGHNLGMHHASTMSCTDAGVTVPLSDTCVRSEYGDSQDVMGTGQANTPSNIHRWQIGLLTDTQTLTQTGDYQLADANLGTTTAPRLLRILRPSGAGNLDLEYRHTTGANLTVANPEGVTVRVDEGLYRQVLRINAGVGTVALVPGASWTDSYGTRATNVTVAVTALTATDAHLHVTFPGGPPPTTTTLPPPTTTTPATTLPPTTTTTSIPPPPGAESYLTGDDSNGDGAWASFKLAQTFTAASTRQLVGFRALLSVKGTAQPTCQVWSTLNGRPAVRLAMGTFTITGTAPAWQTCTLASPVSVTAGVQYALVVGSTGGNGNHATYWRADTTAPAYPGGALLRSASSGAWNTGPNLGRDQLFATT